MMHCTGYATTSTGSKNYLTSVSKDMVSMSFFLVIFAPHEQDKIKEDMEMVPGNCPCLYYDRRGFIFFTG